MIEARACSHGRCPSNSDTRCEVGRSEAERLGGVPTANISGLVFSKARDTSRKRLPAWLWGGEVGRTTGRVDSLNRRRSSTIRCDPTKLLTSRSNRIGSLDGLALAARLAVYAHHHSSRIPGVAVAQYQIQRPRDHHRPRVRLPRAVLDEFRSS